jgi:hypothetical protein
MVKHGIPFHWAYQNKDYVLSNYMPMTKLCRCKIKAPSFLKSIINIIIIIEISLKILKARQLFQFIQVESLYFKSPFPNNSLKNVFIKKLHRQALPVNEKFIIFNKISFIFQSSIYHLNENSQFAFN